MPRKKQGLRSYHHKSRNGCLQCKRRRVKCSMQAPACANCVRRKETCEYAGIVDKSNAMVPHTGHDPFGSSYDIPTLYADFDLLSSTLRVPNSQTNFPNIALPDTSSIGPMLQVIMGRSWFTPAEAGFWSKAILQNIDDHPYLLHCIYSLAYLRRDILDDSARGSTSAIAYEHQMAASALFRQRTTPVQHDNWIPTLSFHVFTLVFEFGSQAACPDSQYNLVDTLNVLRSSHAIEEAAKPFFRASKFWQMVSSRDQAQKYEVDPALMSNLLALRGVIALRGVVTESASAHAYNTVLSLHALNELVQWVSLCEAHPRRWDQYCHWPGHLDPMFLQLLTEGDDFAFLLIIHWSALLNRSPKPAVYSWAQRTARFVIGQLKERDRWESLLIWPLQVLSQSKDSQLRKIDSGEHAKMLEVDKQLRALQLADDRSYEDDSMRYSRENSVGQNPFLDVPPLSSAHTRPSSSSNSPEHIFSGDDLSAYDSTWDAGHGHSPFLHPQMEMGTEPGMLIDPMLSQLEQTDDAYSAGWQNQPR